jgi:hypothetical protein
LPPPVIPAAALAERPACSSGAAGISLQAALRFAVAAFFSAGLIFFFAGFALALAMVDFPLLRSHRPPGFQFGF